MFWSWKCHIQDCRADSVPISKDGVKACSVASFSHAAHIPIRHSSLRLQAMVSIERAIAMYADSQQDLWQQQKWQSHSFLEAAIGAACELEGDWRLPAQVQNREKNKGRRKENKVKDQKKISRRDYETRWVGACIRGNESFPKAFQEFLP